VIQQQHEQRCGQDSGRQRAQQQPVRRARQARRERDGTLEERGLKIQVSPLLVGNAA